MKTLMLLPDNYCYWLKVVQLYDWALMSEGIAYFRRKRTRAGLVRLLIMEMGLNLFLCRQHRAERAKDVHFQFTVWEKICVDCAAFLDYESLCDVSVAYDWFRRAEAGEAMQDIYLETIDSLLKDLEKIEKTLHSRK